MAPHQPLRPQNRALEDAEKSCSYLGGISEVSFKKFVILSERSESKDPDDLRQTTTFLPFFTNNSSYCINPLARIE